MRENSESSSFFSKDKKVTRREFAGLFTGVAGAVYGTKEVRQKNHDKEKPPLVKMSLNQHAEMFSTKYQVPKDEVYEAMKELVENPEQELSRKSIKSADGITYFVKKNVINEKSIKFELVNDNRKITSAKL